MKGAAGGPGAATAAFVVEGEVIGGGYLQFLMRFHRFIPMVTALPTSITAGVAPVTAAPSAISLTIFLAFPPCTQSSSSSLRAVMMLLLIVFMVVISFYDLFVVGVVFVELLLFVLIRATP